MSCSHISAAATDRLRSRRRIITTGRNGARETHGKLQGRCRIKECPLDAAPIKS
ncbi:MAG: hypothetical protein Q7T63_06075 [Burkholderiaceae bacterium]|nr:hypothetical protein [Burkholderiaceae bacterium]